MTNSVSTNDKVAEARKKFGRPFAHEEGSTWRPQKELFLTRWMRERGKLEEDALERARARKRKQ